ncbi:MAG TPA: sulfur carrier protein ThiS [Acidimicrobiales bacterium]|nr:sulfur carrier protein ThiS [Acidimicrobiales bacterium]
MKAIALRVTVNGEETELPVGTSVSGLLALLDIEPRGVAVAVDGEVVTRRTWGERSLAAGEHVEILSIAQGG